MIFCISTNYHLKWIKRKNKMLYHEHLNHLYYKRTFNHECVVWHYSNNYILVCSYRITLRWIIICSAQMFRLFQNYGNLITHSFSNLIIFYRLPCSCTFIIYVSISLTLQRRKPLEIHIQHIAQQYAGQTKSNVTIQKPFAITEVINENSPAYTIKSRLL